MITLTDIVLTKSTIVVVVVIITVVVTENANQKSSSSPSLHQLPNLTLSSSTSCISSLPLTSPTSWKGSSVAKKSKGGRDTLPPDPRGHHGGQGLKCSSSDVLLNFKNSPLFSPTSKKSFFSWMAKGKCQKQSKHSCQSFDCSELCPVNLVPLCAEGRAGAELELEVNIVRREGYKLDGQFFGFADNREPPRLPWHKKEGRGSDGAPVFHSGP